MQTVQSVVGIFGLLAITFAISENRRAVLFRQAAVGLGLTVVLAALFLKIPQLKFSPSRRSATASMPSRRRAAPAPVSCSAISAEDRCHSS